MKSNPRGIELLQRRPLISSDLIATREFKSGTLGKAYKDYMQLHGFKADERPSVHFVDCPDVAYIILRYRQIHDFWHVLCGLPPTVLGEIALKCFELREVITFTFFLYLAHVHSLTTQSLRLVFPPVH